MNSTKRNQTKALVIPVIMEMTKMKALSNTLLAFLIISVSAFAGMAQQTTVILESGPSAEYTNTIQEKTEHILSLINTYNEQGEADFPDEPGSAQLISLLEENPVRAERDTLQSYMLQLADGQYEVRKMFLQVGDQAYEFQELILVYNQDAELTEARFAQELHNFERVLNREIHANEEETERVSSVLHDFANAFSNRDLDSIEEFLADDALIVTGSFAAGTQTIRYMKLDKQDYIDRLVTNTFDVSPDVEVRFEDIQVYRNAAQRNVYAVSLYQYWNTTQYSDEGYMVFMVDLRDEENPQILARSWQPDQFEVGRYADIDPDPEPLAMNVQEIRSILPGDSLSISERLAENQGYVTIIIESDDPQLLNSGRIREWIADGVLEITGVSLDMDGLEETAENEVRIPFDTEANQEQRFVRSGIEIFDTSYLESYSGTHSLVFQRDNVFVLRVTTREAVQEAEEARVPMGELAITILQDNTEIKIMDSDSAEVARVVMDDGVFLKDMEPGTYFLEAASEGYHPGSRTFDVEDKEHTSVSLGLDIIKGELAVAVYPADVELLITDSEGREAQDVFVDGEQGELELAPGYYTATVSKDGYDPQSKEFSIVKRERTEISFELKEEGYEPGFVARNKLWLIAAAAASVATTAVILMTGSDGDSTVASGFPPPPGRP